MGKSVKISAVIITFNEEINIGRCLDSVMELADEIIVVDSFSSDNTEEICLKKGARFIKNPFEGHIEQKNYAMLAASHDYILSLDADEALSKELANSIHKVKSNWIYDGYSFNRLTNYCGRWIRHCGWYPDKKLRLWNRKKGCWGGVNPHDRVIIHKKSAIGHLSGDLLHHSYHTIKQHISQINSFSDIAAREKHDQGETANLIIDILLTPILIFIKKYFVKLGILDGYYGFVISINTAFGIFLKYIKLRELNKKAGLKD
jgi:glycosyltransferase involved in cell wall biosynthesis